MPSFPASPALLPAVRPDSTPPLTARTAFNRPFRPHRLNRPHRPNRLLRHLFVKFCGDSRGFIAHDAPERISRTAGDRTMIYRHEVKHLINRSDAIAIRHNMTAVATSDRHVLEDGTYLIRSLYFDDLNDTALREAALPQGHPGRRSPSMWASLLSPLRQSPCSCANTTTDSNKNGNPDLAVPAIARSFCIHRAERAERAVGAVRAERAV